MSFSPKCKQDKSFALNAEGFLLPCCWVDPIGKPLPELEHLFQDKFNIDNINSIEDILKSEEWVEFFEFKTIPSVCERYCNENSEC